MPIQRRLFGRNVPAISPRRMAALLASIAMFAIFTLVFTLPNSIPSGPSLSKFADHKISLPKLPQVPGASILHPFAPSSHAPPVQKNSTSGESSWYSNWNWMSPFSSSVTLDENRSLLPPLAERSPIYTYYDHTLKKDKDLKEAESELLAIWRRAWWAQGFRPVILGPGDAVSNPLYKELQLMKLDPAMTLELQRWLAWEKMGTGMLSQYTLLPMGSHEDSLLAYLRRGEYPHLTRFDKLGAGLFAGSKEEITHAVKQALANKDLKDAKDMIMALKTDTFTIDPKHKSLAYYDSETIKDKYAGIASQFLDKDSKYTGAEGLRLMNKLMTAHLHLIWQTTFAKGISIIKPHTPHTQTLVTPALHLAQLLAQCPSTPLILSCPPNLPDCKPCSSSHPLKITPTPYYANTSNLYTIGTVPHPYTLALLTTLSPELTIRWIRRESKRDVWITKLTEKILGTSVSDIPRVIKFKDAVASPHGRAHSLWLTAETDLPTEDLDWFFGFTLPLNITSHVPLTASSVPLSEEFSDSEIAVLEIEKDLLQVAKEIGTSKKIDEKKLVQTMEKWNLADTEAWKFARAFLAREGVERGRWEEEEGKFAGGAGASAGRRKKEGSGRWFDD